MTSYVPKLNRFYMEPDAEPADKWVLLPYGNGARYINPIELSLKVPTTLCLGRNPVTLAVPMCIHFEYLSRRHMELVVDEEGKVFVQEMSSNKRVTVNDDNLSDERRELHIGDRVLLLGNYLMYFNYVVVTQSKFDALKKELSIVDENRLPLVRGHFIDSEGEKGKKRRLFVELVDAADQGEEEEGDADGERKRKVSKIAVTDPIEKQVDCSICFEPLASTCTLGPCGCNFCYQCIRKWCSKNGSQLAGCCPLCRRKFRLKNSVPNKLLDNLVREILLAKGVDKEALEVFDKRVNVGNQLRDLER